MATAMDLSNITDSLGRAPLRASQQLRAAIRSRGKEPGNITFFYSPKTDREIVVPSDIQLCCLLKLVARADIEWFDSDPDRLVTYLENEGYIGTIPDAIARTRDGRKEMIEAKMRTDLKKDFRSQLQIETQKQLALKHGMEWSAYTEEHALSEMRLLQDWLLITVVLADTRHTLIREVVKRTYEYVCDIGTQTLGFHRSQNSDKWGHHFSALFQLVQSGQLASDLDQQPLSQSTLISVA
jgi:hypothetical protein